MAVKRVLVTGAAGFIGRALVSELAKHQDYSVTGTVRDQSQLMPGYVVLNDTLAEEQMAAELAGVDYIIHAAAKAHVLDADNQQAALFNLINAEFTHLLARAAASAGVKRFVFLSSIAVNGPNAEQPLCEFDTPRPHSAYGRSKYRAEQYLHSLSAGLPMETTILRLPLVYGPGVKGNLDRLLRLIARGLPLPLASVNNQRSMLGLENLLGAIDVVLTHPGAANEMFMLCDGKDLSTPEVIRVLAHGMQQPARLFPCPPRLLAGACRLTGRAEQFDKLCGSLTVDASKFSRLLGWQAKCEPTCALAEVGRHFRAAIGVSR